MLYRTANLEDATRLAEQFLATGQAAYFRGQVRTWPMISSFGRLDEAQQDLAWQRLQSFRSWMKDVPALSQIASDENAILAVAQHYGLATMLVDFSTNPRVAAYFASHPTLTEEIDDSCIICLDFDELKEVCEMARIARPDFHDVKIINPEIPELWRLQAQSGVFLDYPFDASFEQNVFDFDRIVFPIERSPIALAQVIPQCDVYPTQKSHLEVLLDQYFMLELIERNRRSEDTRIRSIYVPPLPNGLEPGCFRENSLPIHESWDLTRLKAWITPPVEQWRPISSVPEITIENCEGSVGQKNLDILTDRVFEILDADISLRSTPVRWRLQTNQAEWNDRLLELVWEGLRRWPYELKDVAAGMAMAIEYGSLIARNPSSKTDGVLQFRLAQECIENAIEIEIGMEDGSYTRGIVSEDLLQSAMRQDFWDHLQDSWRPQIVRAGQAIHIATDPKRLFVFDRLLRPFCTQFVPTQVALRDEGSGKARLFNLLGATVLGPP